jgi:hypothetical protein
MRIKWPEKYVEIKRIKQEINLWYCIRNFREVTEYCQEEETYKAIMDGALRLVIQGKNKEFHRENIKKISTWKTKKVWRQKTDIMTDLRGR